MSIAASIRKLVAPSVFRGLGIDIFGKQRWLNEVGQWSPAKREQWQLTKLNALLNHCWDNVPFYRRYWSDHGTTRRSLRSLDELVAYPCVSRQLLQAQRNAAIASNLSEIPHKKGATGGTTGTPLHYLHDLELHSVHYAFQMIGWGFAGYSFGDSVFIVSGGSLVPERSKLRNRMRGLLERKSGLYCLQMDDALAEDCYKTITAQRAEIIVGYPSTISLMFTSFAKLGFKLTRLRAVITTAEMLLPQYRRTIEELSGVRVFDHLGCNDGCFLSYECEQHQGLHYNDFEARLEIVDADASGLGKLTITNLWNLSMPFVRYQNGDLASLTSDPCDCGRLYPRIKQINGRTGDILSFSNGKNLTGPGCATLFQQIPVDAWQVVQTGPLSLEVRIKSRIPLPPEKEQEVHRIFGYHLGSEIQVQVRHMSTLTVTSGGKLRPVFSEWKRNAIPKA